MKTLAARYDINPKTVAKWKQPSFVYDAPMGPKQPRSTVLIPEQEAACVAFRKHRLLSLDDCFYALRPSTRHLAHSSLHRCFHCCNAVTISATIIAYYIYNELIQYVTTEGKLLQLKTDVLQWIYRLDQSTLHSLQSVQSAGAACIWEIKVKVEVYGKFRCTAIHRLA